MNAISSNTNNAYAMDNKARCKHRVLATEIIGRNLTYNEVVHHLDENPKNNSLDNLIVLSRANHTNLHKYLREECFLSNSRNKNFDNIRVEKTLDWFRNNNIKYIRLNEINNNRVVL